MKIGGEGGTILVTGCHGGGRDAEVAVEARGAEVWGGGPVQVSGRLSGGSGDALVTVCVGGPSALAGARWSELAL